MGDNLPVTKRPVLQGEILPKCICGAGIGTGHSFNCVMQTLVGRTVTVKVVNTK